VTQLPRRFHLSVNSPRSTSRIEVNAADGLQSWSLPWHERLRSLAKGFGADAGAQHLPRSAPDNWMARAYD
jgi:hypothetical protein